MFTQTVIGAVIVFAVLAVCVAVRRALLRRPASLGGVEVYTLIRARGTALGLEEAVRRSGGRVIIADSGLEREARRRAELLAQRSGGAVVRDGEIIFTD